MLPTFGDEKNWYEFETLETCLQQHITQVFALRQDLSGYLEAPADVGVVRL